MDNIFSKTELLIGKENLSKLNKARVIVFGLGGVGSYAATSLARSGIGHLILVDFDTVDETNINRQEFAFNSTLGKYKTDVAKEILLDINPNINVEVINSKVDESFNFPKDVDYAIDAIDDIKAKLLIVKHYEKVISCMGTAKRIRPELLKYDDIYNTSVCPLCKVFRKECRNNNIENLDVVYSAEEAIKSDGLGSTSFVPPVAGFMLASYVVRKLIEY